MTENNAAQSVLTDDEILQIFADAVGNQEDDARFIDVDRDQAIRIARTLLSKLRAPVADDRALPPCALQTVGPDGTGIVEYFTADQMRAALAGAPVAGEAKNYPGDNVAERLDNMADDQPPGSQAQSDLYAAATIWRKHITHRAAPQASECECARKSKAVADSEAEL